jgi:hypothetical protein
MSGRCGGFGNARGLADNERRHPARTDPPGVAATPDFMTHDFARQRAARATRATRPASPPWMWFLTGVVAGTLGSFLVYLATLAPHPGAGTAATPPAPKPEVAAKPAQAPAEKPQFDFYTILPESEVIIAERTQEAATAAKDAATDAAKPPAGADAAAAPQKDAAKAAEPAKPKPVEVPEPPALMLQAGSFRQFAEADRRRANIILLGYPARVETVNVRGGETWYRVQVGPFSNPRALGEARGALNDQGIATVEIGKRA